MVYDKLKIAIGDALNDWVLEYWKDDAIEKFDWHDNKAFLTDIGYFMWDAAATKELLILDEKGKIENHLVKISSDVS